MRLYQHQIMTLLLTNLQLLCAYDLNELRLEFKSVKKSKDFF